LSSREYVPLAPAQANKLNKVLDKRVSSDYNNNITAQLRGINE